MVEKYNVKKAIELHEKKYWNKYDDKKMAKDRYVPLPYILMWVAPIVELDNVCNFFSSISLPK